MLSHLPWKSVRKSTKHTKSHLRKAITTRGKTWSTRIVPLSRRYTYTVIRVVHFPIVQLALLPLISLPPETKLSKVTIHLTILTMVPHLSLRWFVLSFSWVWFTLVGCLVLGRRSSEMFGRVSSGFLRWLGLGTQTCF